MKTKCNKMSLLMRNSTWTNYSVLKLGESENIIMTRRTKMISFKKPFVSG